MKVLHSITTPYPRLKERVCWACSKPTERYGEICPDCVKKGYYFDVFGELRRELSGGEIIHIKIKNI
jgi:predicted amidophosphoribosyltransferase